MTDITSDKRLFLTDDGKLVPESAGLGRLALTPGRKVPADLADAYKAATKPANKQARKPADKSAPVPENKGG